MRPTYVDPGDIGDDVKPDSYVLVDVANEYTVPVIEIAIDKETWWSLDPGISY